ncbi:MAG: DUF1045 domain-containing protein [Roseovarius sp.]|nr:DUF1045 domain-containing protein [Roseovarius sp.]
MLGRLCTPARCLSKPRPRRPAGAHNLHAWGYPHVMDAFRFHVTLTGDLPSETLDAVAGALVPTLAPLLPRPFVIDAISLMGADGDGRFHRVRRSGPGRGNRPLTASPAAGRTTSVRPPNRSSAPAPGDNPKSSQARAYG